MANTKSSSSQAVALKYEASDAPTIIAKGEGGIAEEIIRLANESNVPLYENAELVQLLAQLKLGDNIPEVLYKVIAEVIAFAYYLQGKTTGTPNKDIPAGFKLK